MRVWDIRDRSGTLRAPQGVLVGELVVCGVVLWACARVVQLLVWQSCACQRHTMLFRLCLCSVARLCPSELNNKSLSHLHPPHSFFGLPTHSHKGHTEGITHISPKGDGHHLISNCKDQTIKLWDTRRAVGHSQAAAAARDRPRIPRWDYRWEENPG